MKWASKVVLCTSRYLADHVSKEKRSRLVILGGFGTERGNSLHFLKTIKQHKMAYWKIVKGKGLFDKRPKRYMMQDNDGVITYHNYKEKVHTWQTKYGPYNTIKEKGGTATFYNVGKEVEIDVVEQLNFDIDPNSVACGYNF